MTREYFRNRLALGSIPQLETGGTVPLVRGLFGGGYLGTYQNVIDYVTIATIGNATDFGDLTVARYGTSGSASSVRGFFGGGENGSNLNVIDYVTLASVGNATDFGDLADAKEGPAGCSNGHGGL